MTKLLKKEENFRFCLLGCGEEQGPWGQNRDRVGEAEGGQVGSRQGSGLR